jgi:hypothetical protein
MLDMSRTNVRVAQMVTQSAKNVRVITAKKNSGEWKDPPATTTMVALLAKEKEGLSAP